MSKEYPSMSAIQVFPWTLLSLPLLYLAWKGWLWYKQFAPDYLQTYIVDESRKIRVFAARIVEGRVNIPNVGIFLVNPERIYHKGRWNTPTILFTRENPTPINLVTGKPDNTSQDFQEAITSHIARDAIRAFREELISTTLALVIIIATILGTQLAGSYFTVKKIEAIATQPPRVPPDATPPA